MPMLGPLLFLNRRVGPLRCALAEDWHRLQTGFNRTARRRHAVFKRGSARRACLREERRTSSRHGGGVLAMRATSSASSANRIAGTHRAETDRCADTHIHRYSHAPGDPCPGAPCPAVPCRHRCKRTPPRIEFSLMHGGRINVRQQNNYDMRHIMTENSIRPGGCGCRRRSPACRRTA